jgi:hypothetical protein
MRKSMVIRQTQQLPGSSFYRKKQAGADKKAGRINFARLTKPAKLKCPISNKECPMSK